MNIPDDLMDLDLPMSTIKRILFVREQKRKAQAVLAPSQTRIDLAQRRVAWADEAETALKNGQEPKPFPKRNDKTDEPED